MRAAWPVTALLSLTLAASCGEAASPDGARALERVKLQVSKGPRVSGTPGNTAVRDWIAGELQRLGGRVERQAFVDTVGDRITPLVNVIGRFGPARGRRIALFAHFDTRPWCDQDGDRSKHDQPVPGANDAGSGVAVLLEVAELMHAPAPAAGLGLGFLGRRGLRPPQAPH